MTVLTVGVTAILGKNIWNPRQKVLGAKAARNPLETLGRDLIKLGIKKTTFYRLSIGLENEDHEFLS